GCQLDRSCNKWDLIPDLLPRIIFAISVFHAYGHQWPCQIVYHPRKCVGFGFSDGEGCERLWSALKALIPTLRVSGFHQRLFALDVQITFLDCKSRESLGSWLFRRWQTTCQRLTEASVGLSNLGASKEELRGLWKEQVDYQTRPLERQSTKRAQQKLAHYISLERSHEEAKEELAREKRKSSSRRNVFSADEALKLEETEARCARLQVAVNSAKASMGVDKQTLSRLQSDEYFVGRLKALAVKRQLRDKLRQRKFELSRLERVYRQTRNEERLQEHTTDSLKRREPTITQLVTRYNNLVVQLAGIKRTTPKLSSVVLPLKIDCDGIFALDVDDNIWDDVGLDESSTNAARWMSDSNIRIGIRHVLTFDRCEEEKARVRAERTRLQEWSRGTWDALVNVTNNQGSSSLLSAESALYSS
ncbi:hypothetical protein CONPUDRAFT_68424, partial [Coniophora puteana RWD-64-598 SS2]